MSCSFVRRQHNIQMKKQLILITDKKKAREGEFIDIRWDCPVCPDSLILTFDSGFKTDRIVVSDSGSTRIAVPKCKGKFVVRLTAGISGKKVAQEVSIRVTNYNKAGSSVRGNRLKLWREKMHAGWCVFRAQCKYWWLSQKKWQKALWIALLALWIGLLIFSISRPSANISSENNQTAFITEQV